MTTRQSNIISRTQFGDNCVVVALSDITSKPPTDIRRVLDDLQCSRHGATPVEITMALDKLGYRWSVKGTREAAGKSPRELSNENWAGVWLVFTKGHVMPLRNGRVMNFNGYGDEPITFVMEVEQINSALCQE